MVPWTGVHMTEGSKTQGKLPDLFDTTLTVKDAIVALGFSWKMDWQAERRFDRVRESDFLREAAWTVLSAGFRESVVRKIFGHICDAFLDWQSAALIQAQRADCRRAALHVFNNHRKVDAILNIACVVADSGFEVIRRRIQEEDVRFLQTLPYIGSITAFHLAKNLGLPVVKPDRHLQRIARVAGFGSPREMCELISHRVGEPIQVVDIVLWRYATLFPDYMAVFAAVPRPCDPGRSTR